MGSLIICMPRNTRFHDVGFDVPKYLLWRDTCIVQIVDEFQKDYKFDDVLLLANKRDQYFKNDLVKEIEKIGLSEKNIHYIGDTNGQAHTNILVQHWSKMNINQYMFIMQIHFLQIETLKK